MEGEITIMDALFAAVSTVIEKMLTAFATVSTNLLSNEIFQIMFGIIVLYLGISFVMYLVRKVKRKGR